LFYCFFVSEKKTGLEDVERDAAIRVTSKPKERTGVSYREALIRNMHVNTYFGGFLGAKKRVPKAGKERMRQIKSAPMTSPGEDPLR
jgi:hypothetical protein